MRLLVACEREGEVRDAFAALGHHAVSCDLEPTSKPGLHIVGDVRPLLLEPWDMVIAFPPCTFLANSGVRWLYEKDGRWEAMRAAVEFFRLCLEANAPRVVVENPTPHRHAGLPKPTQAIQPWMFGHGETKRTCLWLKGVPPLMATRVVEGREQRIWKMSPSPDRTRERSRTFPGIAAAMAAQWG